MACLDEALIHALLDGALSPDRARSAERHISECAACRDARDAAADLRDAATGVLAQAAGTPRGMPAFAVLQGRARSAVPVAAIAEPSEAVAPTQPESAVGRSHRSRILATRAAGMAAAACLGWFAYGRTAAVDGVEQRERAASPAAPSQTLAQLVTPAAAQSPRSTTSEPVASASLPSSSVGVTIHLPAPHFPHADSTMSQVAEADRPMPASPSEPVPVLPPIRIVALEPGATAGTMRVDTEYRLTESADDDDLFTDFELPVLREPVRSPMPSALLRVRAASNAIDTLAGRSLLRRP